MQVAKSAEAPNRRYVPDLARAEWLFGGHPALKTAYIAAARARFEQECIRFYGIDSARAEDISRLCDLVEAYEQRWAAIQVTAGPRTPAELKELTQPMQMEFKVAVIALIGAEEHERLYKQINSPVSVAVDGVVAAASSSGVSVSKREMEWMQRTIEEAGWRSGTSSKEDFDRIRTKATLELPRELNDVFQLHIDAAEVTFSRG